MRVRLSARGVVFNDAGEVLLLRAEDSAPVDPLNPHILRYWVTPGGGVKDGETPAQALTRELWEEAGLLGVKVGAELWLRELELDLPKHGRVLSRERYFLCHSSQTATSAEFLTENERGIIKEHRWWPLDGIAASADLFRPPDLLDLLFAVHHHGPPATPLRIA